MMDLDLVKNLYNYKSFQANSGAIRFTMTVNSSPNRPVYPEIYLIREECPHEKVFVITLNYHRRTISVKFDEEKTKTIQMPHSLLSIKSTEMWLTWYKNHFHMGVINDGVFAELLSEPLIKSQPAVGFIKFRYPEFINFDIKNPPIAVTNSFKQIEGGELRWVKMKSGDQLPIDAFIGGYEAEPIYIARAEHRRSICPGKFVPSKQLAFIPWGHQEHSKREFEILCGYNAMWIKCRSPYLPDNVFIGGKSEVRNEPLYIGRAMINNDLVVGKVHMLYELCYLPYQGKEECQSIYEVIAVGNSESCEFNWKKKCIMLNCVQPCQ